MRHLSREDRYSGIIPEGGFLVSPGGYRVVDGDTLKILTGRQDMDGKDIVAARLRFRSMATPEIRRTSWIDRPMAALGRDPSSGCPGRAAQEQMRRFTKGRTIAVSHNGQRDKYGRLLADISVLPARDAPLEKAVSLERVMIARGVATRFRDEPLPALHPFGDNLDLSM